MYYKLFQRHFQDSVGVLPLSPSFVANSDLCNLDSACDNIDYSESC